MTARATFRQARSLYRRGLREPAVRYEGAPQSPNARILNSWARPSYGRPLCDQATALAWQLSPRCILFLGARDEKPMVSGPRAQFERENPCQIDYGPLGNRRDVSYPYRRQALRELSARLFHARIYREPLYRFSTAGMAALRMVEAAIACDLACREAVMAWRKAA